MSKVGINCHFVLDIPFSRMFVQQTLEGKFSSGIEGKFAYQYNNVSLQGKGQASSLAALYKRLNFPKLRFFTCDIRMIVNCILIISSRNLQLCLTFRCIIHFKLVCKLR